MKYSRVAAIVAGSVAALGAASPAIAATAPMPPMSLNGGLAHTFSQTPLLNGDESMVTEIADTATDLKNAKGGAPGKVLKSAHEVTPLLGGVGLGG
ncbi:hypothetical protein ACQEVG_24720 [Streptomyces sp. CA-135486]|uniref:hypothetical protein n=1 Tax=Streptomyces sp. CA-135486 TaxID=3240049 RepID=UPI003D93E559